MLSITNIKIKIDTVAQGEEFLDRTMKDCHIRKTPILKMARIANMLEGNGHLAENIDKKNPVSEIAKKLTSLCITE